MTMTYSYSGTESFTVAHARKLAGKVSADMNQCRLFYGSPSEADIESYREELVAMLARKFVDRYEFGFKTADDKRIVCWRYRVTVAGDLEGGRSGGLHAKADIRGANLFNFLWTNVAWWGLSEPGRMTVRAEHSVDAKAASRQPTDRDTGFWTVHTGRAASLYSAKNSARGSRERAVRSSVRVPGPRCTEPISGSRRDR